MLGIFPGISARDGDRASAVARREARIIFAAMPARLERGIFILVRTGAIDAMLDRALGCGRQRVRGDHPHPAPHQPGIRARQAGRDHRRA